jgi:hypothetical protein
MQVKCQSCGAIAELKGNDNCIFCGALIQDVLQNKTVNTKSDLTLAMVQYRDNDYEKCIRTLNKIISKDPENQTALVYKYLCKLDLYELNLFESEDNLFNRLKNSGITKLREDVYEDLYITLKKKILTNEGSYNVFNPEFEIAYDKLFDFLNYQNTDFKNKIINILIDVYSWKQNQTSRKIENESGYTYRLGYRPNMLGEISKLIIEFKKWDIDKALIRRAIMTIKELYSATINYYWKEAEQAYNDYIVDKKPLNEDNLEYKINLYREIQDSANLFSFINEYQVASPGIDFGYDAFKYEMLDLESKFNAMVLSKAGEKKKCFIATATMCDNNHPVVIDLRAFRDNWLLKRNWGVNFTNWYYTYGPKAANAIEKSIVLKKITFLLIVKPLQIITSRFK